MKEKELKELRLTKNIIIPFPNFQQNTVISPVQMNDNFEEIEYAYNNLIDNHNGAIKNVENSINTMTKVIDDKIESIDIEMSNMVQDYTDDEIEVDFSSSVNVKTLGAIGDGINDDTKAIQQALDIAKVNGYVNVVIPNGKYKITSTLTIYKNTYLKLSAKAEIIRCHKASFIKNIETGISPLSDPDDVYSGNGNLVIDGGVFDGNILNQSFVFGSLDTSTGGYNGIYLAKAKNIVIKNAVFKDIVSCHAIDVNTIDGLIVDNCRFLGYVNGTTDLSRDYSEAIQISCVYTSDDVAGKADGTPSKNIKISNCYFGNSGTEGYATWKSGLYIKAEPWCTGVGEHSCSYDKYVNNIKITNNTFEGMTYAGVRPFKFKNTLINGNTFIDCNVDIKFSNPNGTGASSNKYTWNESEQKTDVEVINLPQSGCGLTVTNNTFINSKTSVLVCYGHPSSSFIAKFKDVTFSDNTIIRDGDTHSLGNLIDLYWCSNVHINNCTINNCKRGVYLSLCDNSIVRNVFVDNALYEGIFLGESTSGYTGLGHSFNNIVDNCIVKNTHYTGIRFDGQLNSVVKYCYLSNVSNLEDNVRSGILLGAGSNDCVVSNNIVKKGLVNRNQYGISITSSCSNCQTFNNNVEGATKPIFLQSNTSFDGYYMDNGSRKYKVTLNSSGTLTPVIV